MTGRLGMAIVIRNGDTADNDLMINILRTVDPSRHPTVHITLEGYDSARYTSEYLLWERKAAAQSHDSLPRFCCDNEDAVC